MFNYLRQKNLRMTLNLLKIFIHISLLIWMVYQVNYAHAQLDESNSSIPIIDEVVTSSVASDAANEQKTQPTSIPKENLIFERNLDQEKKDQELRILYQQQTEAYLEAYRLFTISKAQWESLQTLAALEEAIARTREVMILRDRTSLTYSELLLHRLEIATGIEITQKNLYIDKLKAHITWLRNHLATTQEASTREMVNAKADEFTQYYPDYKFDLEKVLGLLALGRLQTVIDKGDYLFVRIQNWYQENPGELSAQVVRNRKFDQVRLLRSQLTSEMVKAREVAENSQNSQLFSLNLVLTNLEKPFALSNQYLSFLEELSLDQ